DMNEVANFVKGGINGCTDNKLNYPPFTPSESQMHLQLDYSICLAFFGGGMVETIRSDLSLSLMKLFCRSVWTSVASDNSTEELCTCWMQVGTFYPFSCNHKDQDPAAHVKGETVVRPDPFSICSSVSGKKLYVSVMKVVCSLSRRHPMGLIVALNDNKDGVLSMQLAHNGYQDPNNLKFENITVLGVTAAPALVAVSDGNTVISLSDSQIQYDIYKQVIIVLILEFSVHHQSQYETICEAKISANIDCYPEGSEDQVKCEARGCIWEPLSVPLCYYAENHGYITNRNTEFPSQRSPSQDISKLRVEITYLNGRILLSANHHNHQFWTPLEGKRDYRVQINDGPFGIQVVRRGTEEVIWDSAVPGFTFSDQFLQISTRLPLEYVYGFGETEHPTYKHSLNFHKYGLFAKDQPPGYKLNSYGDVQYADIVNFKGLPALVDQMRAEGMRFIFILDPAIAGNETKGSYPAFDTGIEKDVFIKWPPELSNDIVLGKVWPDYPNITPCPIYALICIWSPFFPLHSLNDNLVIVFCFLKDLNEPASFVHVTVGENCLGNKDSENPPYMPVSSYECLKHKTLSMNSEQILADSTCVKHYDVHNLYGWAHTKPTYDTTGKRGVVVTRSTYPSSGRWAGHWLGDNYSTWDQLLKSIIGMCLFISGKISITGADICGFFNVAEYEMCPRWMQLGAFYPFSRNYNTINMPRQGPVTWGPGFAAVSLDVLNIRYTLLTYLYTLMYEAHTHGNAVTRPMLHEFVTDEKTWGIDKQFLWGPALLVTPALDPGVTVVKGYLSYGVWYDYHTVRGEFVDMDTPLEKINLHLRAGHILPLQKLENNTHYSRQNTLGLIVALNDGGEAKGSLFWDDGEGIGEFCVVVCL
uniref:P-type domain-containing protein n=1 Tax=Sinocyclocheilus grahami TaxID=75366 RepID=A0A672PVR0_SINGR